MPRQSQGYWDERSGHYYVRLGERNPVTGKRRAILLRYPDGRPIGKADKSAVAAAVARCRAAIAEREQLQRGMPVSLVVSWYLHWLADQGRGEATIANHRQRLMQWCQISSRGKLVGHKPAASVTVEDLHAWKVWSEARGNGAQQVRNNYASAMACYRWAARPIEGRTPIRLLDTNPLEGAIRPRGGRKQVKDVRWPVARRILRLAWGRARNWYPRDRAANRLKALAVAVIAHTGCRPGEVWGLRWEEIRWDRGLLVIPEHKTAHKTGEPRRIVVPRRLLQALQIVQDWPTGVRHPERVFASGRRQRVDQKALERWWWDLRKDLGPEVVGPKVTLYWFRHAYQRAGYGRVDINVLADSVGNSPSVLRSTYADSDDQQIKESADRVARARRLGRR